MRVSSFAAVAMFLASAAAPALAAEFNFKNLKFDLASVTRENFYEVVVPLAKVEGRVVMYNFAGNFADTWKTGLIAEFEKKYGIKVEYRDVQLNQANQQLIAVHKVKQDSPADAYFVGGGEYPLLLRAGVVGNAPLTKILPNAKNFDPVLAETVFGVRHGGSFPLVHLNQTAIGYDSAAVKPEDVPTSFDGLLIWAEKNPNKLGVTLPSKGGSGGGFLYSAALNYLQGDCRAKLMDYSLTVEQARRWAMTSDCLKPVWDYYGKLLKVAELTNGNADTLNLINNRQLVMGTVWEDQVLTFIRGKQLPDSFRLTLLENGQVAAGDAFIIPANAKHVAAALLLIDMALGREFQAWKLETKASRSPRTDLSDDLITAETRKYLLPTNIYPRLSRPAFAGMSTALAEALEEKVLNSK
jgi:ABC-type uncharacterized transport system YnjBCD substrate-binding protein